MKEIDYVSDASVQKAEAMERKFLGLNKSSGILFVGVKPAPSRTGESTSFIITLGVERMIEEGTAVAIIKSVLSKELDEGIYVSVMPVRGISGPAARALDIH